jgi:hypothetical protein
MNNSKNFPVWIKINSPKHTAIAKALINYGFCYAGLESNFCIEPDYFLKTVCNWKLYSTYGSVGIDAIYDGALFSYDLHCNNKDFYEELEKIKKLISSESRKFSKGKNHKQLKLQLFP